MKNQGNVIAKAITLTRPTIKATGLSTFAQVLEQQDSLFKGENDAKLISRYNELNPKADPKDVNAFVGPTTEEKRAKLARELSVQIEFRQNFEREGDNTLSIFMERDNISEINEGSKVYFQTASVGKVKALGIVEGEEFKVDGSVVYILQTTTTTPNIKDGNVISNPKRAGKGGNVLTLGGKPLFLMSSIVITNKKTFAELEAEEADNRTAMKHDGFIDAQKVPSDVRDKVTGKLSDQYQSWLNSLVMEDKHFVSIPVTAEA